ncbi:MAG TPA: DNA ligase D [Gemmatimonadaceae bacterium]|nr:DNA ligase D [Gemmatimonadaceae bacterium]
MATRRRSSSGGKPLAEYRRKRDFAVTREPRGGSMTPPSPEAPVFVVQKHAASHLHFDFRLEIDGVMKSWAVPKGPSLDPAVKRLAMEVEDHPIEYNTFEGTIPAGEYGGGTVMLWDRGRYESAGGAGPEALHEGWTRGKLDIVLHGERLRGGWTLVRTRRGDRKPQWLLMKRNDAFAEPGSDVAVTADTSVATGRTMDEIASDGNRVWRSNRSAADDVPTAPAAKRPTRRPAARAARKAEPRALRTLEPMLAAIGSEVPEGEGWTFEPKYDGIRVLAHATPSGARLVTRNGRDKAAQFPEVAAAVRTLAGKAGHEVILDGEIVALDGGRPGRFQELQSRVHLKDERAIEEHASARPAALVAFDLLAEEREPLLDLPWSERRRRLESLLRRRTSPSLHLGVSEPADGRLMLERARRDGWEGIIAKRTDARYEPGKRSEAWLKLKVQFRQEFVVGGFTEPRNSRQFIGALLLGYFDGDRFVYVGHTGGGFDRAGLEAMHRRLAPLERKTSPFEETPKTNEPAHWVRPEVVVEVKFNEWTADGKLRQPIYLGTRDDKDPREVGREPRSAQRVGRAGQARKRGRGASSGGAARASAGTRARGAARKVVGSGGGTAAPIVRQLDAIERSGGAGTLRIARGATLQVTSLDKVFFPEQGYTKGDVMRYYARVSRLILPAIADRPLVLKRTPDGIAGETFFQQKAPAHVPGGVRVEEVAYGDGERQRRVIGGDLATLLYLVQLGCISVDPWLSRVSAPEEPDYAILDLDPGPRAPFDRVVRVAGWVRDELARLRLRAALKTSGSRGLHIALPLPRHTSYDTALLLAQLVATRVAAAHPEEATVERAIKSRPPTAVYVDYLQNAAGKSVASTYCVRAKPGATVSTPLDWRELKPGLDPRTFTIETVPRRIATVGDLWGAAMRRRNTIAAVRAAADL